MELHDAFNEPRGWHLHTSVKTTVELLGKELLNLYVKRERTPTLLWTAPGHVPRNMAVAILGTSLGDEAVQRSVGFWIVQRCLSVANFFEEI